MQKAKSSKKIISFQGVTMETKRGEEAYNELGDWPKQKLKDTESPHLWPNLAKMASAPQLRAAFGFGFSHRLVPRAGAAVGVFDPSGREQLVVGTETGKLCMQGTGGQRGKGEKSNKNRGKSRKSSNRSRGKRRDIQAKSEQPRGAERVETV